MCPNCGSKQTKKVGFEDGVQRYKCHSYNKKFRSKRRPLKLHKTIFQKCIYKRQTLQDLSTENKFTLHIYLQKAQKFRHTQYYKFFRWRRVLSNENVD